MDGRSVGACVGACVGARVGACVGACVAAGLWVLRAVGDGSFRSVEEGLRVELDDVPEDALGVEAVLSLSALPDDAGL